MDNVNDWVVPTEDADDWVVPPEPPAPTRGRVANPGLAAVRAMQSQLGPLPGGHDATPAPQPLDFERNRPRVDVPAEPPQPAGPRQMTAGEQRYVDAGTLERAGDQLVSGVETLRQGFLTVPMVQAFGRLRELDEIEAAPDFRTLAPRSQRLAGPDMAEERARQRAAAEARLGEVLGGLIASQGRQENLAANPRARALVEAGNAGRWSEVWGLLRDDPAGIIQQFAVESLPNAAVSMVPGMAGAALGGRGVAAVAGGVGGYASEVGPRMVEGLTEFMGRMGVDTRDQAAVRAWMAANPQLVARAAQEAGRGALGPAIADALTMGLALGIRPGAGVIANTGRVGTNVVAGTGVEMAGDGLGQVLARGEIDKPGEILAEGLGALPQTIGGTAAGTIADLRQRPAAPPAAPALAGVEASPAPVVPGSPPAAVPSGAGTPPPPPSAAPLPGSSPQLGAPEGAAAPLPAGSPAAEGSEPAAGPAGAGAAAPSAAGAPAVATPPGVSAPPPAAPPPRPNTGRASLEAVLNAPDPAVVAAERAATVQRWQAALPPGFEVVEEDGVFSVLDPTGDWIAQSDSPSDQTIADSVADIQTRLQQGLYPEVTAAQQPFGSPQQQQAASQLAAQQAQQKAAEAAAAQEAERARQEQERQAAEAQKAEQDRQAEAERAERQQRADLAKRLRAVAAGYREMGNEDAAKFIRQRAQQAAAGNLGASWVENAEQVLEAQRRARAASQAPAPNVTTPASAPPPATGSGVGNVTTPAAAGDAAPRVEEGKRKLRDLLAAGKSFGIQTEGDGSVFAAPSLDATERVRLTLTPEERKAHRRAIADQELADTPEERRAARQAEQDALRPAVARAVGAPEPEAAAPPAPTTPIIEQEPEPDAPASPQTGEGAPNQAPAPEGSGQGPTIPPETGPNSGPVLDQAWIDRLPNYGDYGTAASPNMVPLARAFRDAFLDGARFASIAQARALVARLVKGAIDPKSPIAKVVDEAVEGGVVLAAQTIADNPSRRRAQKYADLVDLYARQPRLDVRTGSSRERQAYSTPAPLAFLAAHIAAAGRDPRTLRWLEPTAGTGQLLVLADPDKVDVGEIDPDRAAFLREGVGIPASAVQEGDATGMAWMRLDADAVIGNPPFGLVREDGTGTAKRYTGPNGFRTTHIDHAIMLRALEGMADDGMGVFIVGAASKDDTSENQRRMAYNSDGFRSLFRQLFNGYNVVDHFTVAGALYERQGAAWPVDIIVVAGRGKTEGRLYPMGNLPRIYKTWEEVGDAFAEITAAAKRAREGLAKRPDGVGTSAAPAADGDPGAAGPGGDGQGGVSAPPAVPGAGDDRPDAGSGSAGGVAGAGAGGSGGGGRRPGRPDRGDPVRDDGRDDGRPGVGSPVAGEVAGDAEPGGAAGGGAGAEGGPAGVAAPGGAPGDVSAAAAVDIALGAIFGEEPPAAPPVPPSDAAGQSDQPPGPRTPGQAAASAVKNTAMGADQAMSALTQLFGGGKRLGSGPSFDEETWKAAKPLFQAAMQKFRAAASDIVEMAKALLQELRDAYNWTRDMVVAARPYIERFIADVRAGTITLDQQQQDPAPAASDQPAAPPAPRQPKENTEQETDLQVAYAPASRAEAVGTLSPVNMRDAMQEALARLKERVGEVDEFVADRLGYTVAEVVGTDREPGYFSAEQVDALALAFDAIDKGAGFVIGDQTGVGKGRFVAAMLRYAKRQGLTPIFVTKDPGLYGDMYRDANAIGMPDFQAAITNNDLRGEKAIPLPARPGFNEEEGARTLSTAMPAEHRRMLAAMTSSGALPDGYDALFTTYSQLQRIGGAETRRHDLLRALAPGAMLVLDESHEAGGTENVVVDKDGNVVPTRADFVRELIGLARGAVYSSATWAKNPHVTSLYSKTDLGMIGDKPEDLPGTLAAGGVPLQQTISNMLTEAGQYVRRERSFAGVTVEPMVVNADLEQAERFASTLRELFVIDKMMEKIREDFAAAYAGQTGTAGVANGAMGTAGLSMSPSGFASVMHNLIAQGLLAVKTVAAADQIIAAAKDGRKPVIALSNTMGAALDDYAKDASKLQGGRLPFPTINYLLARYAERMRRITFKDPQSDDPIYVVMTDKDIQEFGGREALAEYNRGLNLARTVSLDGLPISPIDYLRHRLTEAGVTVDEITGRGTMLDYSDTEAARLVPREASSAAKKRAMAAFNRGDVDALILNRSGSTGFSLHASRDVKDRRQREMFVLQAEPDINIMMQVFGRIHRTGQVVLPRYSIVLADLPAEKRPAARLMKNLAGLNANTSSSKRNAFAIDAPEIFNKYGDQAVAQVLRDEPDIARLLDVGIPSGGIPDGFAGKVTGRLAILQPDLQQDMWDRIEAAFRNIMEILDSTGQNDLEAKTLDLDAKTEASIVLVPEKDATTPFGREAKLERINIKAQGRPYTLDQIAERVADHEGQNDKRRDWEATAADYLEQQDKVIREGIAKATQEGEDAALLEDEKDRQRGSDRAQAKIVGYLRQQQQLSDNMKALRDYLKAFAVGDYITLKIGPETLEGRITNMAWKPGKNPLALGALTYTVAAADPVRQLDVTGASLQSGRAKMEASDARTFNKAMDGVSGSGRRETRYVVTGNLAAGFAAIQPMQVAKQFAMFTAADGTVRPGVLLSRQFQPDKQLGDLPVKFADTGQVVQFLSELPQAAIVDTDDGIMTVQALADGRFMFRVKVQGGKPYFLNKAARGLLDGRDFTTRRGDRHYVGIALTGKIATQVLDVYQDALGTIYQTTTQKAAARRITGDTDPAAGFTDGEINASAPDGMDGAPRLDPIDPAALRALLDVLRTIAGPEAVLELSRDGLGRSNGVALGPLVRLAYSIGRTNAQGVVRHEAIHVLRNLGKITDAEWAILTEAAEREGWAERFNIEGRYRAKYGAEERAGSPRTADERMQEEAVADAYRAWATGNMPQPSGPVARIFQKIRQFLNRLRNAMQGRGFADVESIFQRIERGDMGARAPGARRRSTTSAAAARARMDARFGGDGVIDASLPADRVPAWVGDREDAMAAGLRRAMEGDGEMSLSLPERGVLDRIPELEEAAKGVRDGTVTPARYAELVRQFKPVTPYAAVPEPASPADMRRGLKADQQDRIGVPSSKLAEGAPVGLRLDIPAYAKHGVWVVSVHEQEAGFAAGTSIGYEPVAAATNVTLGVVEKAALKIAAGNNKATIAVMKGAWSPITPEQAKRRADAAMSDPAWVQVGMDPTRHAYFYDRVTMQPVVAADEVIQIGPLVLAKNPTYGLEDDFMFSLPGDVRAIAEKTAKAVRQEQLGVVKRLWAGPPVPEGVEVKPRPGQEIPWWWAFERMLTTPRWAFRRNPALAGIIDAGVVAEAKQARWAAKLNKRYESIRRVLKAAGGDWVKVQQSLWAADAQEVDIENPAQAAAWWAEYDLSPAEAKAAAAYNGLLVMLARLTDQHRRAMLPKVREEKTLIWKRMQEVLRSKSVPTEEYGKLYRRRNHLNTKIRENRGDIGAHALEVKRINERLRAIRLDDPDVQALMTRLQDKYDELEARLAATSVRRRAGYVPHKFYGSWRLFRELGTDAEGNAIREEITTDQGFHNSRGAAIEAAATFLEENPGASLTVEPRLVVFPSDPGGANVTDAAYVRVRRDMEKAAAEAGIDKNTVGDLLKGTIKKRSRRRVFAPSLFRSGAEGFSKDLDRVTRTHIAQNVRYVTMDRLKFDYVSTTERIGLSPYRMVALQQEGRKPYQQALEAWWRDVNGSKQDHEESLDRALQHMGLPPSVLASLAVPAAGGWLASSPLVGVALGGYLGWRMYNAQTRGGEFPFRTLVQGITNDMAHAKLGMVLNVMSAVANLSQTALNTLPVMGLDWTLVGSKRAAAALLSQYVNRDTPGRMSNDAILLTRVDITSSVQFDADATRLDRVRSAIGRVSMVAFESAEKLNRATAFLAAYAKAESEGKSPAEAMRAGEAILERTQFGGGSSNRAELMRIQALKVPLQFKNFMLRQTGFFLGLTPKQMGVFLLVLALLGGLMAWPLFQLFDWLAGEMSEDDVRPSDAVAEWIADAQMMGDIPGGAAQAIARGLPALLGMDMTQRIGMGAGFFPDQGSDFYGPFVSTAVALNRIERNRRDSVAAVTSVDSLLAVTPAAMPLKVAEAAANGSSIWSGQFWDFGHDGPWGDGQALWTNPRRRAGSVDFEPTTGELVRRAAGAQPVAWTEDGAIRRAQLARTADRRKDANAYLGEMIVARRNGRTDDIGRIWQEARENGVQITPQRIREAFREADMTARDRAVRQTPRQDRGPLQERTRALDERAGARQ